MNDTTRRDDEWDEYDLIDDDEPCGVCGAAVGEVCDFVAHAREVWTDAEVVEFLTASTNEDAT